MLDRFGDLSQVTLALRLMRDRDHLFTPGAKNSDPRSRHAVCQVTFRFASEEGFGGVVSLCTGSGPTGSQEVDMQRTWMHALILAAGGAGTVFPRGGPQCGT